MHGCSVVVVLLPSYSSRTMSSSSVPTAVAPSAAAMEVSPLLKNEDVLGSLLCWCPPESIGRIGQCSKALRSFVSDPHQTFWLAHLLQHLSIPSREVGNVAIAPDQSAKSLLQAHVHAQRLRSPQAPQAVGRAVRVAAATWDYEPTLSIVGTGQDTYNVDNIADGESPRDVLGHDFSARCHQHPIPHVPYVVRRRRAGDGKILDVGLSSICYFEVRLVARNAQRQQQRPNALHEDDPPPPQACVAIGLSTSCFRLSRYQPGWTEDSIGYHSDDGRLFFASGTDGTQFGPNYGSGDVVGCGVHIPTMSVFFTKNGSLIGTAFSIISSEPRTYRELYPTIGMDSKEFTIQVRFGADEAFAFDVSKAEQLFAHYSPPARLSARLSSRSGQTATGSNINNAPNPSEILDRIGLECTYPEAASFHPWNSNAVATRIYVQQRDTRRYMWLDDADDESFDDDEDGNVEDYNIDALEAMLSDGYDYVSYDDSTYGSNGDDDDDGMDFDSEHDEVH